MIKRLLLAACCLLPLATAANAADDAARAALERRLERLQGILAGDVCANPDEARAALAEGTPASAPLSAAPDGKTADAAKPQPALADRSPAGSAAAIDRDTLVARLKQAVVLVVAGNDSGSGFFVTPTLLMTNAHVVAAATPDKMLALGPGIGVRRVSVVAQEKGNGLLARDYALLRIEGDPAPTTLTLTPSATELESVVAAGFPGLLLRNDMNFYNLLKGTPTGLPDLILSQGSVMAVQNRGSRLPTIAHSAAISGGNSGGPLVDACGRVIGINTFMTVAAEQASKANYAISAEDVIRFLREHGVTPQVDAAACK